MPRVCWAARPKITEITPAEARTVVMAWRATSKVLMMATTPTTTTIDWVRRRSTWAWVSKRRERPWSESWRALAASSKTHAAAYAIQVRQARATMSSTCMRNVVIDVPFQSDRWGLTRAMPSPAHAPQAANVKWPGRRTRARIDEAVAAFARALRKRAERRTETTTPTKAPIIGPRIRRVRSMVVVTAASAPDCASAAARVRASETWARAPRAGVIVMHQA